MVLDILSLRCVQENQVTDDFKLKEKIWNRRFRFRVHQHIGNVEIMGQVKLREVVQSEKNYRPRREL